MSATYSEGQGINPAITKHVKRATTTPRPPCARRQEKLTPPCRACNLPLLKGETRCPRCDAQVPA